MRTSLILAILTIGLVGAGSWVAAQQRSDLGAGSAATPLGNSIPANPGAQKTSATKPTGSATSATVRSAAEDRLEGEKRFRTNCSRCHQYPHKFPPRAVATIIRHMRVRATITDEDARLILRYMSQ